MRWCHFVITHPAEQSSSSLTCNPQNMIFSSSRGLELVKDTKHVCEDLGKMWINDAEEMKNIF